MNKVVIAEGSNALDQIFIELEVEKTLQNIENVLIKPNLRAAGAIQYKKCSITNPLIIESLVKKLLDLGKQVSIGECTSSKYITQKALENSGVISLEKIGVDVLNLNLCETKKIKITGGTLKEIDVPLPIVNSNFVISLPVMKTHKLTLVTLSMKNMMGATSEMGPSRMHCAGINQSIADINTVIKPDLCIIDATKAMEGSGPVRGSEVILNTLIGGYDPVSVDSIGAKIMGFDPYKIEHILLAEKRGVGKIKPDIVIGTICSRKFVKPGEDEVEFTDLYSFKWFNRLMSNRFIHKVTYDFFYYLWKKRRNKIKKNDAVMCLLSKGLRSLLFILLGHIPSSNWRVRILKLLGAKIRGNIYLAQDLIITTLGTDYRLDQLVIEEQVAISHRVTLVLGVDPRPSPLSKIYTPKQLPIHIKRGVWIGAGAIILQGVTIGKFSIVAAGAVVTEDVPAYTVVAGVPAKVVKKIPIDNINGDKII